MSDAVNKPVDVAADVEAAMQAEAQTAGTIDPRQADLALGRLQLEQSLFGALIGGFFAAILGALIWAAVTVATGYQFGLMAIGVGLLVGLSVRKFGNGIDGVFGAVGAGFALFGCLLGNLLAMCGSIVMETGAAAIGLLNVMSLELIVDLMIANFAPFDLLFYAIAIYEGYKIAFREITHEDLMAGA